MEFRSDLTDAAKGCAQVYSETTEREVYKVQLVEPYQITVTVRESVLTIKDEHETLMQSACVEKNAHEEWTEEQEEWFLRHETNIAQKAVGVLEVLASKRAEENRLTKLSELAITVELTYGEQPPYSMRECIGCGCDTYRLLTITDTLQAPLCEVCASTRLQTSHGVVIPTRAVPLPPPRKRTVEAFVCEHCGRDYTSIHVDENADPCPHCGEEQGMKPKPEYDERTGVPFCPERGCPAYDGTRSSIVAQLTSILSTG